MVVEPTRKRVAPSNSSVEPAEAYPPSLKLRSALLAIHPRGPAEAGFPLRSNKPRGILAKESKAEIQAKHQRIPVIPFKDQNLTYLSGLPIFQSLQTLASKPDLDKSGFLDSISRG